MQANITPVSKYKEYFMSEMNFKTLLNGARNDFKIAVDDLFNSIEIIHDDVEKLKLENLKPNKDAASLMLDYLGWEDGQ
jgi:hypothetical protein